MIYPLAKNGVFATVQGEGALLGEPMVFVRLAGCSIGCPLCDTDYKVFHRLSAKTIAAWAKNEAIKFPARWVWITGGEPTDHDLGELIEAVRDAGFMVALATAGHREFAYTVDWSSVSPHDPRRWVRRWGSELKLVPGLNGFGLDDFDLSDLRFQHQYVQPCDGKGSTVEECLEFLKKHQGWRMTVQAHKSWGLA